MGRPSCPWNSLHHRSFNTCLAMWSKPVHRSMSVVTPFQFLDSPLATGDSCSPFDATKRLTVCVWNVQLNYHLFAEKQELLAKVLQHCALARHFCARFCHAEERTDQPIAKRSTRFTRTEKWAPTCDNGANPLSGGVSRSGRGMRWW
jgi:hypothetical protein